MKYGLIAQAVSHSFSAEIHNRLFGYEYELKAIPTDGLDAFMREKSFTAINVTIPYKQAVIPYLDHIDQTASDIGAVNTVVNRDGSLYGYNTDCVGMQSMLEQNGISLKDKKVLILGSGGTSKTAYYLAKSLGCASVYRVSRGEKDGCITYETAQDTHSDADVLINTTPCGMYPNIDASAIDISRFDRLSAVVDAVYNPLRTKLVCDALQRDITACGGLYMLVAQAAYAAEKFVGKTVSKSAIDEIYKEIYNKKQNVVLIGMPACGKTTVGRIIADRLSRELVDTDEEIQKQYGSTPSQIITNQGEAAFRDIESEVIQRLSVRQGIVIATGGGAVLRKQNVDSLRRNGRIYFIDRPLEMLVPTADRPLSADVEAMKKRYTERYGVYLSSCDAHIDGGYEADQVASTILKEFL